MARENIYHLQAKLDTNCPKIFEGNWEAEHKKGWRWECNVYYLDHKGAMKTLDDYIEVHGSMNVTIGHPFNEDLLKPGVLPGWCGLYVRDVQDLVTELARDLEDLNLVERWLHE